MPTRPPKRTNSSRPARRSKPPAPVTALAPELPGDMFSFLDRDLSWLEFNARVLHEAIDERTPLLDRLMFLGIFTSNLDEFAMKRIGLVRQQLVQRASVNPGEAQSLASHLLAVKLKVLPMLERQARCFTEQIMPALAANGIHLVSWDQLTPAERDEATRYFEHSVFPVLTPQAVDLGHPFPFLSNLSISLAIELRQPDTGEKLFARVKVPKLLAQWVRLGPRVPGTPMRFIGMQELVRQNLSRLFRGMEVVDAMPLRVTRSAYVTELETRDGTDLLELVEQQIRQRRMQDVIRLEHGKNPNRWLLDRVVEQLGLSPDLVYEMPGEIDFTRFREIVDLAPALRSPAWTPTISPLLASDKSDIFAQIRQQDLLVHHPYETFDGTVARFIRDAVEDDAVLCIKMTVYRTSDDSPFVPLLIAAAERGKQVVCLVELKARFDENRNIHWAEALEDAGVHVVYGFPGLKTHCKTALVIRREGDTVRSYAHIGTGNYNPQTAKLYEDLGLLTANPAITGELVELFHYLTGRSIKRDYSKLLVAPVNMKARFLALIAAEAEAARSGKPAGIVAKLNQLEDTDVCVALQQASQAGVPITLIVRGLCVLRPGVPGTSERIQIVSLIGRFLEHSRVFYFRAAAEDPVDGLFYIGSADWMSRNLVDRVEVVAPIEGRSLRERLWTLLQTILADQRQVWRLNADGGYVQRTPSSDTPAEAAIGTHRLLMQQYLARNEVYQPKRR